MNEGTPVARRSSRRFRTRTLTGTALLIAMGVVLPFAFHGLPLGGRIFLPMHIPALIAGLLLGPVAGLIVGVGSPILSVAVTGRPPVPYLIPMVCELATYGVAAGLLRPAIERVLGGRRRGTLAPGARRRTAALFIALALAMVVGRLVWTAVAVWLAPVVGIDARPVAAALAAIGAGWPGMAIQLVLIPSIVRAIERPSNS
jgi:uncharacterized membrane protein